MKKQTALWQNGSQAVHSLEAKFRREDKMASLKAVQKQ